MEICWSSLLLGVFKKKKLLEFSLTSFTILICDCVIKTIEMFNFVPLINNSVTAGFSFLWSITSAIKSSKTVNILRF